MCVIVHILPFGFVELYTVIMVIGKNIGHEYKFLTVIDYILASVSLLAGESE